jgi:hypothetical protein
MNEVEVDDVTTITSTTILTMATKVTLKTLHDGTVDHTNVENNTS